jgi:nitrogen fixation protein NifX
MKIAFATTDGVNVNEHFGRAGTFAIYDVTKEGYTFVELRKFADGRDAEIEETKGLGQLHDDKVRKKVDDLSDCRIIYVTEIGGPSAARLVKRSMMPVKVMENTLIEKSLQKLLDTIRTSPPPWIRKAMQNRGA